MHTLWIEAADIAKESNRLQAATVLMVMPVTDIDQAKRAQAWAAARTGWAEDPRAGPSSVLLAVHDTQRNGFVQVTNQVYKHSRSPYFGYMAQDAYAGREWLALALRRMQAQGGGLLAFNDGKWHGELAAFGLAERRWADANYAGEFFFPGYRSHYADVELTLIARQQQRFVYEPDSVLLEVDWKKDGSPVNPDDRSLFRTRVRQGLGGRVTDTQLLGLFR